MAMTLKPKSKIIPMEESIRIKTEKNTSSSVKCEGFAHCFLRLQYGVVYHEFLPQDRMVNKEYYLEVMCQLRKAIRQKCTELWKNQSWILHHDNASAHTSILVREFLNKNKTVIMPQLPYSPDLALADFFLFPKLKTPMKGKRFSTIEEIKEKSKQDLLKISKSTFQKCFEEWKKR